MVWGLIHDPEMMMIMLMVVIMEIYIVSSMNAARAESVKALACRVESVTDQRFGSTHGGPRFPSKGVVFLLTRLCLVYQSVSQSVSHPSVLRTILYPFDLPTLYPYFYCYCYYKPHAFLRHFARPTPTQSLTPLAKTHSYSLGQGLVSNNTTLEHVYCKRYGCLHRWSGRGQAQAA